MQEIAPSLKKPLTDMLNFARLSFYCLIAAVFLAPILGGRFDLTSAALLYVLLVFSALLTQTEGENPNSLLGRAPERSAFSAFLFLAVLSSLISVGAQASLVRLFAFAGFYLIFMGGARLGKSGREWSPALAIAASGALLGLAAIAEYHLMRDPFLRLSGSEYRVFGTFSALPGFFNPGFFAGFLVIALPVTLGLYCGSQRKWLTVAATVAWLLELAALMLTGARFGALAFAAAVVVFVVLLASGKHLSRPVLARLAVLAVLSVIPLVFFNAPMISRVAAARAQSHSMSFRLLTWQATARIVADHPLWGTGPGTFHLVFPKYAIAGFTRLAHNSYLQFASEVGVSALIAFVVGTVAALAAGLRGILSRKTRAAGEAPAAAIPIICGFAAGVAASLIRNLTDSDWYVPGIGLLFWLSLGLISASGRRLSGTEPAAVAARTSVRALWSTVMLALLIVIAMSDMAAYYAEKGARESADREAALADYRQAARLAPLSAEYRMKLARASLAVDGEPPEARIKVAIPIVQEAIRLEPTSPTGYMLLGNLRRMSLDSGAAAALSAYREAEKRDPHSPSVKIAVADALESLGRHDEAIEVYERILEIEKGPYEQVRAIPELVDPTYAYAHFALGQVYEAEGKTTLAVREYKAVVERIDRRNRFAFAVKLERAADDGGRADESRITETYKESRERLKKMTGGVH
ncbi:MAG: O-antigen ligase family protein [Armatimonadota bacterium]|nr:O-antigen ligase family protein [Armatimonadota bacterium]